MKVTLQQMITAISSGPNGHPPASLDVLTRHKSLRASPKFRLATMMDRILTEYKVYGRVRQELLARYAEIDQKTDEILRDHTGGAKFEAKKNREGFEKEHESLLETTVNLPGRKFSRDDIKYIDAAQTPNAPARTIIDDLTAADINNLFWLFDETCFDEQIEEPTQEKPDDPKGKSAAG